VPVLSCEGDGPRAKIEVGTGLLAGKSYAFRIRVGANPAATPTRNKWTITISDESSLPFDGFTLWAFTQTSITPRSTAMSASSGGRIPNSVTIRFRPFNNVGLITGGGVLSFYAPTGYEFFCPVTLDELYFDPQANADSPSFSNSEMSCEVSGSSVSSAVFLSFTSMRHPMAGRDYRLIAGMYTPLLAYVQPATPPTWRLASYQDVASSIALDQSYFQGFHINPPMSSWSYTNRDAVGNEMVRGSSPVTGLLFEMSFPNAIDYDHQIVITAPPGFQLAAATNTAGEKFCRGLRWEADPVSKTIPLTSNTLLDCDGNRLVMTVREGAPLAFSAKIRFRLDTVNPPTTPSASLNYWNAQHRTETGVVQSSAEVAGWRVLPQLGNVQLALTPPTAAAGVFATLTFTFVAVTDASEVQIEAKKPLGLDFSTCCVTPVVGLTRLQAIGSSVRLGLAITAGSTTTVVVHETALGNNGGQTEFDLTTYSGESRTTADQMKALQGFRLPGLIRVTNHVLQNAYALEPSLYPVRSTWQPRLGSSALAFFTMTFSDPVARGQELIIKGEPYMLYKDDFVLMDMSQNVPVAMRVFFVHKSELRAEFKGDLVPARVYRLAVRATIPRLKPTAETETWQFSTSDGGALPTSTSNGLLEPFHLVSSLGFSVHASRSPPLASVEVTFTIDPLATTPASFTIVAPLGFNVTDNCLISGGLNNEMSDCQPGPLVAGRPSMRLTCRGGRLTNLARNVKVRIKTPKKTPTYRSWFAEALMANTGEQLGWGEDAENFAIVQMRDVSVTYAAMPLTSTLVAFQFLTTENLERGGKIRIEKPSGLRVQCDPGTFHAISLPGILECKSTRSWVLLSLNDTLTPGEYAFAITAETPAATPTPNLFSLMLINKRDDVQDAIIGFPGLVLQEGLPLSSLPLFWSSSQAGQLSTVTLGLAATQLVPAGSFATILITLPENFVHAIEQESDVQSKNRALPLRTTVQGGWIDFSLGDRLVIHLDPAKSIPAGEFPLSFQLTVPEQIPSVNLWKLTLCRYSPNDACLLPGGSLSVVTFPIAGFSLGQLSPNSGNRPPAVGDAAPRQVKFNVLASIFLLLVCL